MPPDLWKLYTYMLRSRLYEEAVAQLWRQGLISGEMHLGTGEEAINAGVVAQMQDEDAMALDHRGTAPMLMRGVDPVALLQELLGHPDGLCGGMGGHMHLFSRQHLAASSGIVGASGPGAVGFALAAQFLRPGSLAVAFFGEGAANQGMLLESLNLAAVWNLPVLFVCKDDDWAITTPSESALRGELISRAHSFGVDAVEIDGTDVEAVWQAAAQAMEKIRGDGGPAFLHAHCVHLENHFLGYQMRRVVDDPLRELPELIAPLTRSILQTRGAPLGERISSLKKILGLMWRTRQERNGNRLKDPLRKTRARLASQPDLLEELETAIQAEIEHILQAATLTTGASGGYS